MKVLAVIPLVVAACVGAVALLLKFAGARFGSIEPLLAFVITSVAGIGGILPVLRSKQTDAVAIVQLALIATVLHTLCTMLLGGIVIFLQLESLRGPFVFWLLAAYWVSLAILVWQLRQVLLALTTPKVQN